MMLGFLILLLFTGIFIGGISMIISYYVVKNKFIDPLENLSPEQFAKAHEEAYYYKLSNSKWWRVADNIAQILRFYTYVENNTSPSLEFKMSKEEKLAAIKQTKKTLETLKRLYVDRNEDVKKLSIEAILFLIKTDKITGGRYKTIIKNNYKEEYFIDMGFEHI